MEKGHGNGVELVCDFDDGDVLVTQTTVRAAAGSTHKAICVLFFFLLDFMLTKASCTLQSVCVN